MPNLLRIVVRVAALAALALPAFPQQPSPSTDDRVRALEEQIRSVLDRLSRSEERNAALEAELLQLRAQQPELVQQQLDLRVADLLTKLEKPASAPAITRSGKPLTFYGFFRFDTYWNSARLSNPVIPFFVLPENGAAASRDDDQFAFDARLTRIGLDVDAGTIGDAKVKGKLETDFANFPAGVPESRETPRIRLAYIDLVLGKVTIRAGQDWDTIAPLLPWVNSETLMWNAGNLGDRRPQASVIWSGGDREATSFQVRGTLGLTGAVDNLDLDAGTGTFTSTRPDGFDSGTPHGQLRAALETPSWVDGQRLAVGAWGLLGRLETDTSFVGRRRFTTWTAGADVTVPLAADLLAKGEAWFGEALGDVRGGIGQSVNTTLGQEIASVGGWAEVQARVSETLTLAAGGTVDDPSNADLSPGMRRKNWTAYVGSRADWGSGFKTGVDVIFWETDWVGQGIGNAVRANAYAQLDF